MVATCQENALPERLAREDDIVRGSAKAILKKSKAKVHPAVIQRRVADQSSQLYVPSVSARYI